PAELLPVGRLPHHLPGDLGCAGDDLRRVERVESSLLDALTSLFERYWETAVPLDVSAAGTLPDAAAVQAGDPLSGTDRRILSLLVAGIADKAIASQMGLSRRTIQRHIQRMMSLAGATTRMQLAWQAARRGWL
ncbi:LuxR C-terminal-related transcriptional regulator, partial [Streptomyces sp. NPDC005921]